MFYKGVLRGEEDLIQFGAWLQLWMDADEEGEGIVCKRRVRD